MDAGTMRYLFIGLLALLVAILSSAPVWGISSRAQRKSVVSPLLIAPIIFGLVGVGLLRVVPQGKGLDLSNPYSWASFLVPLALGLLCHVGLKKERISIAEGSGQGMQAVSGLLMGVWILFLLLGLPRGAHIGAVTPHDPNENIVVGRVGSISQEMTLYSHNLSLNIPPSSLFLFRLDPDYGMLYASGEGRCMHHLKVGDRVRIKYVPFLPVEKGKEDRLAGLFTIVQWVEILKEENIPKESLLRHRAYTSCSSP